MVSGCPAAHTDGQVAAKTTRRVSVRRVLQSETETHFTRRPTRYKCAFCSSKFKRKDTLKNHISAVHEGKRFACTQCQCTFVSRSGLTEHDKHVHRNLPRYKCEQCGKGYVNRLYFLRHVTTHAGGE